MAGIFKSYDVRGVYPESVNRTTAEKIGRAYAELTKAGTVAVGRDMRLSSEELFDGLTAGLVSSGVRVLSVGCCSTPVLYHAVGTLKTDGGIMITASHNPGQWNGFKFCLADAIPMGSDNGLKEMEEIFNRDSAFFPRSGGGLEEVDILDRYGAFVRQFADLKGRTFRIAVDFGNGMGSVELSGIRDLFELIPLYEEPDGSFPNHEANPLKTDTLHDLCRKVKETGADFGVALDGDADRCGFVDETGSIIPMDFFIALAAGDILKKGPAVILHDLRSSKAVPESIAEKGGKPVMTRVGHSFIKKVMRETGAAFGGELSGHYYFRENFCAESPALAFIRFANMLSQSGKKASELAAPLRRYASTGELNYEVSDIQSAIEKVRKQYSGTGKWFELDGVSGEYGSWRFNLRPSNTEPLLRLIVEADTAKKMTEEKNRLLSVIFGNN